MLAFGLPHSSPGFFVTFSPCALGGQMISGSDVGVTATTLAVDESGKEVIALWQSTQFPNREHLRFNRSVDGGEIWLSTPIDFAENDLNPWFSDYLPELAFDAKGNLHVFWSQRNDTAAPCYTRSHDLGDTWSDRISVGGGTLPRDLGVALLVDPSGENLWTFHQDFDWRDMHRRRWTGVSPGRIWEPLRACPHQGKFAVPARSASSARYILRENGAAVEVVSFHGENPPSSRQYQPGPPFPWVQRTPSRPTSRAGCSLLSQRTALYIFYALMRAVRNLGQKHQVDPSSDGGQSAPVLAILDNSEIVVAWQQENGATSQISFARSSDGGGDSLAPPNGYRRVRAANPPPILSPRMEASFLLTLKTKEYILSEFQGFHGPLGFCRPAPRTLCRTLGLKNSATGCQRPGP